MIYVVFSSRRRHTRCALGTGVQTCALPTSDRSRAAFYRQGCGRDREWRPDVALDAGSPGDRRRAVVAGRYDCGGARWSVVGHAQFYSGCRMRRNGFTLIELLVALVIFAMLAGAGVLLLGNSVAGQGTVRERLDELASIQD